MVWCNIVIRSRSNTLPQLHHVMQGSEVLMHQNKIENTGIYVQACLIDKANKPPNLSSWHLKHFYLFMTIKASVMTRELSSSNDAENMKTDECVVSSGKVFSQTTPTHSPVVKSLFSFWVWGITRTHTLKYNERKIKRII